MRTDNKLLLLLLVITAFSFLAGNGGIQANIMEARNLTTAREILENNDWMVPTMNGELRLEKPPLPTWVTAVCMKAVGQDNLSLLRIPGALMGMLLVFFLFRLTREMTDDKYLPFLAGGTAATSFYIFFMARAITWDIFCHSFMLGAIWMLWRGWKASDKAWSSFLWAGVLLGLSFMSKGPVAFFAMLLPFLIAYFVTFGFGDVRRQWKQLLVTVGICFVISFWWPVYIYLSHPEFSTYVAHKESTAWVDRHVRPWYHYWSFVVQSGIWVILSVAALVIPYAKKRINELGNYKFIAVWIWAAVILLSLFPEKKERYLMPVLIPLALIVGFYVKSMINIFREKRETKADRIVLGFNGYVMTLIAVVLPVAVYIALQKSGADYLWIRVAGSVVLFWSLALYLALATARKLPFRIWGGMVVLLCLFTTLLIPVSKTFFIKNPDYKPYTELRYREDLKALPFFFNGVVEGKFIEVVWATGHRIKYWNSKNATELPVETPFVFLSYNRPEEDLPPTVLENYTIELVGRYDGKMRTRREAGVLANYVTIIRKK